MTARAADNEIVSITLCNLYINCSRFYLQTPIMYAESHAINDERKLFPNLQTVRFQNFD